MRKSERDREKDAGGQTDRQMETEKKKMVKHAERPVTNQSVDGQGHGKDTAVIASLPKMSTQ